jgi:hypothetical protein
LSKVYLTDCKEKMWHIAARQFAACQIVAVKILANHFLTGKKKCDGLGRIMKDIKHKNADLC